LIDILGQKVSNQSDLFLNFVLQDALLITPLLDILQLPALLLFIVQATVNATANACSNPFTRARGATPLLTRLPARAQKLIYPYKYSRAMMIVNVGVMFACIAPVVVVFVLVWLAVILPIWAYNFQNVLRPRQGASFDSGGAFWPVVVELQVVVLMGAQFVLAAIQALNYRFIGMVLLLLLLLVTIVQARALKNKYQKLAKTLPLETSVELDACLSTEGQPGHADDGNPSSLSSLLAAAVHDYSNPSAARSSG